MSPRDAARWAAAGLATVMLVIAWTGLFEHQSAGRLVALGLLALLPAAASRAPRARAGVVAGTLVVAALLVAAIAARTSPFALIAFDGDAWSRVGAILPDGLREGSEAGLPVSFGETPALVALLCAAFAAFVGAAAWQIVVRGRPVAGVVILGVGLAYRWTVEPPASGAGAAILALMAFAAILALATWDPERSARPLQRAGGALVLGGAAVALAAGIGTGPAQAGDAWWSWKDWDIGGAGPGSASLDLDQTYGSLDWPEEPRVVMTVGATTARPIRAVSLEGFDGNAFTLVNDGGSDGIPIDDGVVRLPWQAGDRALDAPETIQRITLVGTRTSLVMGSGRMRWVSGPFSGTADLVGDGLRLKDALGPGDRYTLRTSIPSPTPSDLVGAPPLRGGDVPAVDTALRASGDADALQIPLWGSGLPGPSDRELGAYAPVRDLARSVAADAPTEYAAVNRIEAHLRSRYIYSESPPYPARRPDGTVPSLDDAPAPGQLPAVRPQRLLPALRRRDGGDAAHARHPGAGRGGLHGRPLRHRHRPLRGARPRRPLVGGGLLPGPGLAAVRPHAGPLRAEPGVGVVAGLCAQPVRGRPGRAGRPRRRPRHHRGAPAAAARDARAGGRVVRRHGRRARPGGGRRRRRVAVGAARPAGSAVRARRRADGAPLAGAHPRRRARARDRSRPGVRVVPAAVRVGAARDGLRHGARRGGPRSGRVSTRRRSTRGPPAPATRPSPPSGGRRRRRGGSSRPPCARSAARRRCVAA